MRKILIADDHPIIRNGVMQIIKDANICDIVFLEANNFKETETILTENTDTDMIILDIKMPGMNAISSVKILKGINPDVKVLIFSSYEEKIHASRYYFAGADGYLQKDCEESEIQGAIKDIFENGKFLSVRMADEILNNHNAEKRFKDNPFLTLSNREMEVAQLMINGFGNLEIANELNLRESTVSTYKNRIYEKLGINTITDLFQLFQDYSFIR